MVEFETASDAQLPRAEMGTVTATCLDGRDTWVIALVGEHDRSTLPLIERRTRSVWRRCGLVVVDLSAATFVDSSAIEWLLRTRQALLSTGHQGPRVVTGPPGTAASHLLSVVSRNLRDLLACHATIDDAIDAPTSHRAAYSPPPRRRRARARERVPTVFDQVEARAWVLAVWIVRDVQLADEIVIAAFTAPAEAGAVERTDDDRVRDVRFRAIAAAPFTPPATGAAAEAVREAILGLPEPQREAVELSLFGGLSLDALATVTATSRAVVIERLVEAMRVLRPALGRRAGKGGELAAALPGARLRLVAPPRWPPGRTRAGERRVVPRRVGAER